MTKEHYYAVRIGKPGDHTPFFMIGSNLNEPMLFSDRNKAKQAAKEFVNARVFCRVVKVTLHDGRCR